MRPSLRVSLPFFSPSPGNIWFYQIFCLTKFSISILYRQFGLYPFCNKNIIVCSHKRRTSQLQKSLFLHKWRSFVVWAISIFNNENLPFSLFLLLLRTFLSFICQDSHYREKILLHSRVLIQIHNGSSIIILTLSVITNDSLIFLVNLTFQAIRKSDLATLTDCLIHFTTHIYQ